MLQHRENSYYDLVKMAKNHTVPGYETTYNHYYRAFCTREKDMNIRQQKKIIQLSELDAEVCKVRQLQCECNQINALKKKNVTCDLKKWSYLANVQTEYGDKMGSLWANFSLKNTLPKKFKRGMALEDMEKLVPADSPTYIYTLDENQNRKECSWWLNSFAFPDDMQCRISREYQKRQFLLTEKLVRPKS